MKMKPNRLRRAKTIGRSTWIISKTQIEYDKHKIFIKSQRNIQKKNFLLRAYCLRNPQKTFRAP